MNIDISPNDRASMLPLRLFDGRYGILGQAIEDSLINRSETTDPSRQKKIVNVASAAISGFGKIPYLPIAMQMPIPYPIKIVSTGAECLAFWLLDCWAITDMTNDLFSPKVAAETQLLSRSNHSPWKEAAVMTAAIGIAAFAQLPGALPALDYDSSYAIPGFTILLLSGLFYPVYSLKISLEKLLEINTRNKTDETKVIESARERLLDLIDTQETRFLSNNLDNQRDFVESIQEIQSIQSYLTRITTVPDIYKESAPTQFADKITTAIGIYRVLFLQTALAIYTWTKTKQHLVDNNAVAALFTLAEIASNTYLMGRSIIEMTHATADLLLCKENRPTLGSQLNPSLLKKIQAVGISIALLGCFPTTWVIWGNFYEDKPILTAYFQFAMCMNYFLLILTANLQLSHRVTEAHIRKTEPDSHKALFQMQDDFQKLRHLIQTASTEDFNHFLNNACPQELQEKLSAPSEVQIISLDHSELQKNLV